LNREGGLYSDKESKNVTTVTLLVFLWTDFCISLLLLKA